MDELDMVEVMHKSFQGVCAREREFYKTNKTDSSGSCLCDLMDTEQELTKNIDNLDVRKSQEPDGIFNWSLKECRKQPAGKIHRVIKKRSLKEGVFFMEWKSAARIPIYL